MWWVELLNSFVSVLDSGGAGGAAGSFESIATVNGNGANSITFSSIPSTYKHLQIRATARSNEAAGQSEQLRMRFNGVSTTSYTIHRLSGDGTSVIAEAFASQTFTQTLDAVRNNEPANVFGVGIIDIHDYTSTTKNKTVRTFNGYDTNTSGKVRLSSGLFVNTAAIDSITLFMAAGPTFINGTSFALYGIKGA
jgi:hypothetical protein